MAIMNVPLFLPGEKIYYTGSRFADRLRGKPGWIHWGVSGNPNAFVCEFPGTRNGKDTTDSDDYIMSADVITRQRPHGAEREPETEVQPRRRKKDPEEE